MTFTLIDLNKTTIRPKNGFENRKLREEVGEMTNGEYYVKYKALMNLYAPVYLWKKPMR